MIRPKMWMANDGNYVSFSVGIWGDADVIARAEVLYTLAQASQDRTPCFAQYYPQDHRTGEWFSLLSTT